MIIAETYVRFGNLESEEQRRQLARALFPITEDAGREFFNAFDVPRIGEVLIEEGSTKVRARVRASAIALITIVGGYGTVRTGIDYARSDGRAAAGWMLNRLRPMLPVSPGEISLARRRSPAGTRLHRLFERVQAGELSPDEATERAEQLFRDYGETSDTVARVSAALRQELLRIEPSPQLPLPRRGPPVRVERQLAYQATRRLSVFRDQRTGELVFSEQ